MFSGKVVTFISVDGAKYTGIVVECAKDMGISIVDRNNKDRYLYCLRMKLAPTFLRGKGSITRTRKRFTEIRSMIIKGNVDLTKSGTPYHGHGYVNMTSEHCAFH